MGPSSSSLLFFALRGFDDPACVDLFVYRIQCSFLPEANSRTPPEAVFYQNRASLRLIKLTHKSTSTEYAGLLLYFHLVLFSLRYLFIYLFGGGDDTWRRGRGGGRKNPQQTCHCGLLGDRDLSPNQESDIEPTEAPRRPPSFLILSTDFNNTDLGSRLVSKYLRGLR